MIYLKFKHSSLKIVNKHILTKYKRKKSIIHLHDEINTDHMRHSK